MALARVDCDEIIAVFGRIELADVSPWCHLLDRQILWIKVRIEGTARHVQKVEKLIIFIERGDDHSDFAITNVRCDRAFSIGRRLAIMRACPHTDWE